jgi:hypothetical protein
VERYRKAVVAFVGFAGAVASLILTGYDPTFTEAVAALVGPAFAVVGVIMAGPPTVENLSKAVAELQGAALYVASYFVVVDPGTVEKIGVLLGAVFTVYGVWYATNEGAPRTTTIR